VKGVRKFASNKSRAFYKLLLRCDGPISDDLSAAQCNDKLKSMDGAVHNPQLLKRKPGIVVRQPAVDDDSVDGDAPAEAAPLGEPEIAGSSDDNSHMSSSPSSPSESSSDDSVDGDGEHSFYWPTEIMGAPCVVEKHKTHRTVGLRLHCRNPDHIACKKYRSVLKDTVAFGRDAPVHFLSTWQNSAFVMDEQTHRKYRPSRLEVRDYLASL